MITAQVASTYGRRVPFQRVIEAILPQVDKIRAMISGYDYDSMAGNIPEFLQNDKIEVVFIDNSLLDGHKLYKAETNEGFTLIVDDDIEYPENFVSTLLDYQNKLGGIVSIMGANLCPRPIKSYSGMEHEWFRAFSYVKEVREAELIGMCGALYHSDEIRIGVNDIHVTNSDINMSFYCKKKGIKMHVIPHLPDWCADLMLTLPPDSVTMWGTNKERHVDRIITEFINNNL